jgi:hypothetical protein
MKSIIIKITALVLACALAGCVSTPTAPAPAYTEGEFDDYPATGTASVSGQAFSKTRGGDIKFGGGNTINLYRAPKYLKQFILLRQQGYSVNHTEPALLAMTRTAKTTVADGNGNFEFTNIPAGEYLLETTITWLVPGGGITGGPVQKFITVKDGESQRVMLTP